MPPHPLNPPPLCGWSCAVCLDSLACRCHSWTDCQTPPPPHKLTDSSSSFHSNWFCQLIQYLRPRPLALSGRLQGEKVVQFPPTARGLFHRRYDGRLSKYLIKAVPGLGGCLHSRMFCAGRRIIGRNRFPSQSENVPTPGEFSDLHVWRACI